MSLLSKRRPKPDSHPQKKNKDDGTLSKRKPATRKPFIMSRTQLEYPIFGGGDEDGNNKSESFKLMPSSTSSSTSQTSSNTSSLFTTTFASSSSISSTGGLYTGRSTCSQEALGSSKLSTLAHDGPIEATPVVGPRRIKRMIKHDKSLTKGSAWFDMAKAEVTKDKKNDLEALKLRSAMDGPFHYKRNNITHTPKYFHVGTVVETSADFYSSRIPKKLRKKTLAQEFAADYGME